MDEGNQRGHDAGVRLPLHPRKAQELFFELLQAGPSSGTSSSDAATPRDTPTPRSLQQRLARSQQYSTDALKVLQRGQWVRSLSKRRSDPMVQLRLSSDGSSLQARAFGSQQHDHEENDEDAITCVGAVDVSALCSLAVLPNACFTVSSARGAQADDDDAGSIFESLFEAESDDVLACIAVAVASAASAQRDKPANQQDALLWQAARLRVVELVAAGEPLRDAVAALETKYDALAARETQSELPSRGALFFLRAG